MKSINTPFEIDGIKMIVIKREQTITDFVSRITLNV